MTNKELRETFTRVRRTALDVFIVVTALLLILSGVTRIMVGDTVMGMSIILGVLGIVLCIWHVGGDFRWFRRACVYPTTGIHVCEWGYYTEGEPICRLYRTNGPMQGKTFSICFNILLPPTGSRAAWETVMSGIDAWMKDQPRAMRLRGHMSANSQIAEVELCVLKEDATPEVLDSLYDCFESTADKSLADFGRRYIRVDYPDRGHVFYAAFDGFDIGRAVIAAGEDTAWFDLGDARGGFSFTALDTNPESQEFCQRREALSEACSLYVDDNPIEGIRQSEIISLEEFEKLWRGRPA